MSSICLDNGAHTLKATLSQDYQLVTEFNGVIKNK